MTEWQPIETMPEGEITCLVYMPDEHTPIQTFTRIKTQRGDWYELIGFRFVWDCTKPSLWAPITQPA